MKKIINKYKILIMKYKTIIMKDINLQIKYGELI